MKNGMKSQEEDTSEIWNVEAVSVLIVLMQPTLYQNQPTNQFKARKS